MKDIISLKYSICFVLFLTAFTSFVSCRRVYYYEGKLEILSTKIDNTLNDSVLLYGKVFNARDNKTPSINARVWVNELTEETYADNSGAYSLKLPTGIYTVNCQEYYGSPEFIETRKDVSLLPNEKIELNFYLGGRDE